MIMTEQPKRVGLYIKPDTRVRLNKLIALRSLATGDIESQDSVINWLLDSVNAPSAETDMSDELAPA